MKCIYTIGYAGFQIDEFIKELKKYNITCLIDVRSKPYSGYYKDYNKENLIAKLKENNILYRNYSLEFGAWQPENKYYTKINDSNDTYYLDFKKYQQSECFQSGYKKIISGINLGYTFAFMCSEIEPINCHRNIIVAKYFYDNNYNILNIIPQNKGVLQTQNDVESQMLTKLHKKLKNLDNSKDKIALAYELTNIKIGYKKDIQ